MILKLLDYNDDATEHEIGNLEDIAAIMIRVVSGDEIANVIYKDYTVKDFDSSDTREMDFYDFDYEIYRFDVKNNLIDNPKFKERRSSYWYWYEDNMDIFYK